MGLQKYRADKAGDRQANGATPFYTEWMGGPSLALVRNCPVENADIGPRTVYVRGEPDTWFSIPATCAHKGKTVTGYLTMDDGQYVFRAHPDQGVEPSEPNTVPNLDCMERDELMAFWKRYHRATRSDARALIGDTRRGFTNICATLANYACNKSVAMGCRLEGNIPAAITHEQACDLCYERIPEDLRW